MKYFKFFRRISKSGGLKSRQSGPHCNVYNFSSQTNYISHEGVYERYTKLWLKVIC